MRDPITADPSRRRIAANRSFDTAGLESREHPWMNRWVRVRSHPEWGVARVLRWYPAAPGQPELLRLMPEKLPVAKLIGIDDVELAEPRLG